MLFLRKSLSDGIDLALSAVADSPSLGDPITSPTTASRAYSILGTVIYDAWSAYEPTSISTRLGDSLQRPLGTIPRPRVPLQGENARFGIRA